jgi:hypothetical protein
MMDYDTTFESKIASKEICNWVWSLRESVARHQIREIVGTRMVIQLADLSPVIGFDRVKEMLVSTWTQADRQKCGV